MEYDFSNNLRTIAVMENVANIATGYMCKIGDILEGNPATACGSDTVVRDYIIPWAWEAQQEYERTQGEREANGDYYDWLDAFCDAKIEKLREDVAALH